MYLFVIFLRNFYEVLLERGCSGVFELRVEAQVGVSCYLVIASYFGKIPSNKIVKFSWSFRGDTWSHMY